MKLKIEQFEAAVYLIEKSHGNKKSEYEEQVIHSSGLSQYDVNELQQIIIDGFNIGIYSTQEERISVYWCLGKLHKRELIPLFTEWLSNEFNAGNPYTVYQLLISLGNMEEPVFNSDREGGSAYYETELNMRDAKEYLNTHT